MPRSSPSLSSQSHARGTWLVAGLLLLGMAAGVGGIWFQREQTRRCLGFYGAAAARRITTAPDVELLTVKPGTGPRRLMAASSLDVSHAAGLVHLRRGLVEDANFTWEPGPADEAVQPLDAWDVAIVFTERGAGGGRTALVVDLDRPRSRLAVVGQPGSIGLGRIGPGLETWIRDSLNRAVNRANAPGGPSGDGPVSAAKTR